MFTPVFTRTAKTFWKLCNLSNTFKYFEISWCVPIPIPWSVILYTYNRESHVYNLYQLLRCTFNSIVNYCNCVQIIVKCIIQTLYLPINILLLLYVFMCIILYLKALNKPTNLPTHLPITFTYTDTRIQWRYFPTQYNNYCPRFEYNCVPNYWYIIYRDWSNTIIIYNVDNIVGPYNMCKLSIT